MPSLGRRQYYWQAVTVTVGASNQEVDILGALQTAGRSSKVGSATWLYITTDVAVTVKINSTSAHSITVGTTSGITVPAGVMAINKLYFSHTGASSASGDATVTIRAA